MDLTGFVAQVDIAQIPEFTGSLTEAIWLVYNAGDKKIYRITANQIAVVGNTDSITISATAGTVTNVSALHGRKILTVQRGGTGIPEVIYSGTPATDQCLWDNVTNDLTCPAGNVWLGGEKLTLVFV